MSGDPAPPLLTLPTCCPFHESGGTWDSGHREQRVGGFYNVAHVGSVGVKDIKSVGQREGESLNDALTRAVQEYESECRRYLADEAADWIAAFAPCEALRSRDPGAS